MSILTGTSWNALSTNGENFRPKDRLVEKIALKASDSNYIEFDESLSYFLTMACTHKSFGLEILID